MIYHVKNFLFSCYSSPPKTSSSFLWTPIRELTLLLTRYVLLSTERLLLLHLLEIPCLVLLFVWLRFRVWLYRYHVLPYHGATRDKVRWICGYLALLFFFFLVHHAHSSSVSSTALSNSISVFLTSLI